MTFPQFAYKNITRNLRAYMAFYLSSSFAVMIFFMFAMFIFHPALETGYMNNIAKKGMKFAEWIIFGFSIFFILYSLSTFLKTRKKEFGILTIHGASPKQLRWLITLENVFIGLASIITGILGGTVLAKFFFIAGAYMVKMEPLQLYFPLEALGITVGVFLLLFILISQFMLFTIHSEEVISLLKGSEKPKKEPKPSILFSVLGILFLGTGFGMSLFAGIDMGSAVVITLCTVIGTYLFYSQLSVWMIQLLKRNKKMYRKGINLLWISDLTYRIKDNARLFFIVSIVSAVAFTATGTLATYKLMFSTAETSYAMEFLSYATNQDEKKQLEFIKEKLEQENIDYQQTIFKAIEARQGPMSYPVLVVSHQDWVKQFPELQAPNIHDGEGIYYGEAKRGGYTIVNGNKTKLLTDDQQMSITLQSIEEPVFYLSDILVVDHNTFRQLEQNHELSTMYGFQFENWKESLEISQEIQSQIVGETFNPNAQYFSKAVRYFETVQLPSLSLFIGLFIAIIFFLAAGSFLYFRLFADLYEERKKYKSLAKIGLSEKEMVKISTIQMAILFFLPFLLAIIETGFALHVLQREGGYFHVFQSGVITILGFLGLQIIYFIIMSHSYNKHLKEYVFR
ncbi:MULTISPECIES: FtsX-like permease family protein [Geobacillus]|jgi:putative ABC transport system permease protein|uniref:ABC transporter (Permease) n=4 Tax=Geobacillus TaxID=129337 RepID=A4IK31_GEOTN|nr:MULTISPECIES: ABC transporter permease [Geobacillus]ABO65685.1 ABC transporter (permease) [Geobacillus thermodenitrificans NG80-2]ARP41357.1 putative ABC transporter permease YvcS [Geobacillus thermodenitrificans]ATO37218.1 peptide ABC transporter permease [Geobacillus thermodenitrificans]KQB94710.1 ABC transporter permease protein YxdM [Geobacillus sp. PA-3]MED3907103.1 ABC transporter permease [Geobacillus thermodenitrificans]